MVRHVDGITDRKPVSATITSVEVELLAPASVAVGYNARTVCLGKTFTVHPRLDGECRIICESAEVDALNVASITITRGEGAKFSRRI